MMFYCVIKVLKFGNYTYKTITGFPTRGALLTGRNHNRYCMWKANTPGRACKANASDFNCPARPASEITIALCTNTFFIESLMQLESGQKWRRVTGEPQQ